MTSTATFGTLSARIQKCLPPPRPDLRSATEYLHTLWAAISLELFGGTLSRVGLTIQSQGKHSAFGWCTVAPVWHTTSAGSYHEVNVSAEYLDRGLYDIVGTLIHEAVHLDNIQKGIQDCSRGYTYHNKKFRDAAEAVGLVVTHSPQYGHAHTTLGPELEAWVDRHGWDAYALDLYRGVKRPAGSYTWTEGGSGDVGTAGKKGTKSTKKSSTKHVCPSCGLIARTTKSGAHLVCGDCDEELVVEGGR